MYRRVLTTLINATILTLSYIMNDKITKLMTNYTKTEGIKYSYLNKFIKTSLSWLGSHYIRYTGIYIIIMQYWKQAVIILVVKFKLINTQTILDINWTIIRWVIVVFAKNQNMELFKRFSRSRIVCR